jgi:hypothetical protein
MRKIVRLRPGITLLLLSLWLATSCKQKVQEKIQEKVTGTASADSIPLPEHPRPDFQRRDWANLNGTWAFEFDSTNAGEAQGWTGGKEAFSQKILVPFPWGSPLSGVENKADIAWYRRSITIPSDWKGKRVFLVVGASDWLTTGWLDGKPLGSYQGGYTPFEFDLTDHANFGQAQNLVMKVDDSPHDFKLFGKQGYGDAKGIWQTVYLEAREPLFIQTLHFTPDIDRQQVRVDAQLNQEAGADTDLRLRIKREGKDLDIQQKVARGKKSIRFTFDIPDMHLWSLEDPYLYEVRALLGNEPEHTDAVETYFGMRKIGITALPGTDIPYVSLNNKPVYLQLTLDQSYHPEGFYTFPSDAFMKEEILRSKQIGLNGQRIHIKVEVPRKLYWADKLGVLIMADVPNSWGEPGPEMRKETETALRAMVQRDYNHPSIFSWINFNETWGLFSKAEDGKKVYKEDTQQWVADMYRLTKSLDSTRLVEDNSACNFDHVVTDINTWHAYLPGYEWKKYLDEYSQKTFPGSNWNFVKGYTQQANQPMFNSECGNVWGYEGSTGDVDWSWDYHWMMNEFRSHPKVAGWLYTEHHDVINEWNGYYRYDRSLKFTGLDSIVPGMTLNDLHAPVYLAPQGDLGRQVKPGAEVKLPLWLSVMSDAYPPQTATLETELVLRDELGGEKTVSQQQTKLELQPWASKAVEPLVLQMPQQPGLAILRMKLKDQNGNVLQHNFSAFRVSSGPSPRVEKRREGEKSMRILRFAPDSYRKAEWSSKNWKVLNGLKVNGTGSGYFEYELSLPKDLDLTKVQLTTLQLEVSAKELLGKDKEKDKKEDGDYMLGKGLHDPGKNLNAYPMTDEKRYPSRLKVLVNGQSVATQELKDDPADHQGLLSWMSQPRNRTLQEAGSYGYLLKVTIPAEVLAQAAKSRKLTIRLAVDESLPGGLAIYGERFGRYPIDPMLIFQL